MEHRIHKINNSLSQQYIYRWCKKNKLISISEAVFSSIIKDYNSLLVANFLKGEDIKFPYDMGSLELRKSSTYVRIDNNKLSTNRPIDWLSTNRLWDSDPSSKEHKVLVRFEIPEIFKIYYNKRNAKFKNKIFYKFFASRQFKKLLSNSIKDNNIDAFTYELY